MQNTFLTNYAVRAVLMFALVSALAIPADAADLTVDDFDPADPSQAETYREALGELIGDMTIDVKSDDGDVILQVTPFPMEFIILYNQYLIHSGNITDENELAGIVERANRDKPAANSFAFTLSGVKSLAGQPVTMYCLLANDEGEFNRMEVPVYVVDEADSNDVDKITVTYAVALDDMEMYTRFLTADSILLVSGEDEDAIELGCGFWRTWGLFDRGE